MLNKNSYLIPCLCLAVFIFSLFVSNPGPVSAEDTDDFVITGNTNNTSSGSSTNTQITIPTTGTGYNYNVDCDDDGPMGEVSASGNYICTYASAGTYTIRIKDNTATRTGFPRIYFNNSGDRLKLQTIEQWGTGK